MNILRNMLTLFVGLVSVTIIPGLNQIEVFATSYGGSSSEDMIANPSGSPLSNSTSSQQKNIPSANPAGSSAVGSPGILSGNVGAQVDPNIKLAEPSALNMTSNMTGNTIDSGKEGIPTATVTDGSGNFVITFPQE